MTICMAGQSQGMNPLWTPECFVQKGSCKCRQEVSHIMCRQNPKPEELGTWACPERHKKMWTGSHLYQQAREKNIRERKRPCHKVCRV